MSGSPREAYDVWHRDLDADRDARAPWHDLVRGHLALERDVHGKTILEVGCGRGGFTSWLAALPVGPRRIVAVDVSPVAVIKGRALAAERGLKRIDWEVGDIQSLAHPSGRFDTIISCETVEHLHEPGRALAELARVLRVGGHLFLTTPNYLGTMGLYRMYLRMAGRKYSEVGQPVNRLTMWPRTLAWVRRAGLRTESVDGIGHYLLFPRRAPLRILALDRLRYVTQWMALHSLIVAAKR